MTLELSPSTLQAESIAVFAHELLDGGGTMTGRTAACVASPTR